MKTFKEYLIEFDRSDIALQQQHNQQQQAAAQDQASRTAFSDKMKGSTPVVGDIIRNAAGDFEVVANNMGTLQVKQQGNRSGKVTTVPNVIKFKPAGQENGRNIFTAVQ